MRKEQQLVFHFGGKNGRCPFKRRHGLFMVFNWDDATLANVVNRRFNLVYNLQNRKTSKKSEITAKKYSIVVFSSVNIKKMLFLLSNFLKKNDD
jgi:hypothetical protein